MAANAAYAGEGEKMTKPSGSGFGVSSTAAGSEISMMERKEDTRGSRGRQGRQTRAAAAPADGWVPFVVVLTLCTFHCPTARYEVKRSFFILIDTYQLRFV